MKTIFRNMDKYKSKMIDQVCKDLEEYFKNLFQKHQFLKSISWLQYTKNYDPDGYNGFKISQILFKTIDDVEDTEYDGYAESYSFKGFPYYQIIEKIDNEFSNISCDDDLMKDIFGDDVKIIINQSGKITIKDYEHND